MKDIHEVLRQKQAKYAQLAKQIEMLRAGGGEAARSSSSAATTDHDRVDSAILAEVEETQPVAAKALCCG